jgi:hypothetical protein
LYDLAKSSLLTQGSQTNQMSTLRPWFPVFIAIALTTIFLVLFGWIFSLDEDPSRKQGVDYIPLRPRAKAAEVIFMFSGSICIAGGIDLFLQGSDKGIWPATFGLAFTLFAGLSFNTHLWLDSEGMHYRIGFGKVQSIRWKDLQYYDIQRITCGTSGTTVYFRFHSSDDTLLSISRTNYDISSLLEKIRTNSDIREQPYKKRSWFSD